MNRFRLTTPAQIGPGELVGLTPAQYAPRARMLDLIEERARGEGDKRVVELVVARATALLSFKAGEIVGFAALPKNLAALVEPLQAPATPVEQIAAAAMQERRAAAARKDRRDRELAAAARKAEAKKAAVAAREAAPKAKRR